MISGRVLDFIKSHHQKAQELLPWLVNGTLPADEAAVVEQHLQSCAACRAELQCLRTMAEAYVQGGADGDAERALARLRPRLTAGTDAPPAAARPQGAAAAVFGPAAPWPWLRVALAVQLGVIVALTWMVVQPEQRPVGFHTLSAAAAPSHAPGSVVVVFDPLATQLQVAQLLRQASAKVIDGPTASDGYVLSVPDGALATALAELRASHAVVLAEPLVAPGPR
jgi:anti-sigma factor RsiW